MVPRVATLQSAELMFAEYKHRGLRLQVSSELIAINKNIE